MGGIIGIVASPGGSSRTLAAVQAVVAAAGGTNVAVISDAADVPSALTAMDAADGVVFGSPVYRAGHTSLLRLLLEKTQRGRYGETAAPLQGSCAAIVMTGASLHHFLAPTELRGVLADFFAVQVVSPALYLSHADFVPGPDAPVLSEAAALLADQQGRGLCELTDAVRSGNALRESTPQA